MKINSLLLSLVLVLGIGTYSHAEFTGGANLEDPYTTEYLVAQDTIPLKDRQGDFINDQQDNPFDLQDPSIIDQNIEYDPGTGQYIITEKIGDDYFRMPSYMTFDEYMEWSSQQQQNDYFQQLAGITSNKNGASGLADPLEKIDVDRDLVERLFGGTKVDIRPQGNIDLTFGVDFQRVQNPNLTLRQQKQGGFDFDMAIQMSATGQIGEKLKLGFNYNTQATFDFENQMKLEYASDNFSEDEIVKKIEAGHVSLPLKGSLIQGVQSLFGLKTELQFGRLRVTGLASQQKSKRENIQIQGGSQLQEFEVRADEYDENRHFFLSHYNRAVFEESLTKLPQINSLFRVSEIQVWITNDRNETQNVEDVVALADLSESTKITNDNPIYQLPATPRHYDIFGINPLPGRELLTGIDANDILRDLRNHPRGRQVDNVVSVLQNEFNFDQAKDFEKVSARMLSSNEYSLHPELGFLSINVNLRPDQVLGVAYTYEYNGKTYKVGEFSNDASDDLINTDTVTQEVFFIKMLKSSTQRIDLPAWDLMMKNVYSIGAFQVSQEDFRLDIFYEDPGGGEKRFLPDPSLSNQPLLRLFNLDRLNTLGDPYPDGQFDFVSGVTINPQNGRIMFPVLEPFGSSLKNGISASGVDPALADQYTYQMLYDSTLTRAREFPEFNRYTVRGSYKSSVSSEISLGAFNLPPGSVVIRAGGQVLIEGQDYEVDYNIGRVKILNDAILNSGLPINVSFEDNTLFGLQTKTLIGLRADYEVSKNLNIGGTYMHLFERPFTQKVNIGDDPISNKIYGLDINYSKDAPWLTKMVDAIPLINTKEASSMNFMAEAAFLRPGHSKAINDSGDDKGGVVYLDDFEGSTSGFTLTTPTAAWSLASVPQNDSENNNNLFPESKELNSTLSGVNRAHVSWYRIDNSVGSNNDTNPYTVLVNQQEIFPNRDPQQGAVSSSIQSLNLSYYPSDRGSYNFDEPGGGTQYSAGLSPSGGLLDPESRWGGIQRALNTNDFEAANIEYIEFWLLNPFMETGDGVATDGGDLYIELGNISEDVLRDSRKFFENGIPTDDDTPTVTTSWGRIPVTPAIVPAFANEPADARDKQDVGLDGVPDAGEGAIFSNFLEAINNATEMELSTDAKADILADISNDNFVDPRGDFPTNPPVLDRYYRGSNVEGNSPIAQGSSNVSGKTTPDTEDIDQNGTLNESESYFQYKVRLDPVAAGATQDLALNEYVTDIRDGDGGRKWYRFKIPLDQGAKRVGGIQDFRSIRFMRMYMHGFKDPITLRFATLELVRNQWRRYRRKVQVNINPELNDVMAAVPGPIPSVFDVNAVNIEENSSKIPFGYVLPLGLKREQSTNTTFDRLENEQSLALEFCDLLPGNGNAIYKIINLDMRVYDNMQMYVHGEPGLDNLSEIPDTAISVFVRLGSDFEKNYYEYELPVTMSVDTSNVDINSDAYRRLVWPDANNINISFEELKNIKIERNDSGHPLSEPYEKVFTSEYGKRVRLKVKGNPNMGYVKGAMIGVINRSNDNQCAEVWVNELRVGGINERGGAAALARLDFQLADFGNITLSGNYSSIGWGELEQKVNDRAREQIYQYDIAGSFELGKFLPEKSGIKIPAYFQYSNAVSTPEYDPYDLDIPLKEKIAAETDKSARDSIRNQAIDQTEIKSWNLTNVRKERTNKDKTPMPWNIENFSVTYAYTETKSHDPIVENDQIKRHNGILNYDYSRQATFITPFKKLIKKDKYLKLISELNFNPLPNTYGFSTTMNRTFHETTYRFVGDDPFYNTFYNKKFTWDRNYNLSWDITRALKFNFSAINRSIVDEQEEYFTGKDDPMFGQRRSQSVINEELWNNIKKGGRTKGYNHNFSIDYTLPLKKIPFLDWVTVKASYQADYSWDNPYSFNPYETDPDPNDDLGFVVMNGQTKRINGDVNFESLYKKSKYLSKINKKSRKRSSRGGKGKNSRGSSDDSRGSDKGRDRKGNQIAQGGEETGRNDRRRDQRNPKDDKTVKDIANGNSAGGGVGGAGKDNQAGGSTGANPTGSKSKKKVKKKKGKGGGEPSAVARALIRPLLLLRKGRFNYTENRGTIVPGFTPTSEYLGMSTNNTNAPGFGFVSGFQPRIGETDSENDWLTQSAEKGWITDNTFQNQKVIQNYTQNIDARLTLEPFPDFKIDLDAKRSYTENSSLYFKDTTYTDNISNIVHAAPRDIGSFTISYFSMNTLFDDDITGLFSRFEQNREVISDRIGSGVHEEDENYTAGYGRRQQDVLLPAFLAAYTDKDPNGVKVSDEDYAGNVLFKMLPKVNWNVTYGGLSKMNMFKEIFSSVNITHGYKSTLTVNSFSSDQEYNSQQTFLTNDLGNFYSRFEIPALVINETFSPLLGIDMRLKNDMTFRVDYKKARNLAMGFVDYSLNETKTEEFVFGFGYKMKNVVIGFLTPKNKRSKKRRKSKRKKKTTPKPGAKKKEPKGSDLNFIFDFSFRDDITIIHKLDTGIAEPTRGLKTIRFSPSIDYDVNDQLNLRLFFDRSRTIPATSASYPITNTAAGLTIRFTLK